MLSFLKSNKPQEAEAPQPTGWAARLKQGLARTRGEWTRKLEGVFSSRKIDESLYEELETALLSSDVGVAATRHLLEQTRFKVKLWSYRQAQELKFAFQTAMQELLDAVQQPLDLDRAKPLIIMIAGVNGSGKTTSIGKLAMYFKSQGKSVLLAAGDTFRAAAREQLKIWGERNHVSVMSAQTGDAAAVVFDAVAAARARKIDVLIADTAGRLPTQLHLMEEIKKMKRVIAKADPQAPHEIWLTLDANTGQNAVAQVKAFDDALGLTGLIVTKLDGTAKGGAIAAIARERPIPLRFIGVGEQLEDLRPFDAQQFVEALIE
ncbi:MAG TPA: signal recognition particle-docking protein FtsY [Burkholderiales bacterium]|nr:signal recognition particle-docking protein FtsY [Burkholderiales bacterium]